MASHNGAEYISAQLESVSHQDGVKITLLVSDDHSTDDTVAQIEKLCAQHKLDFRIMPTTSSFGGAAKNFFRMIKDIDASGFDYIALADQDDIWHSSKLKKSTIALQIGADAVSSDVTAVWPNGTTKLIIKSQQQRQLDFLFESAGPGCTFVLSAQLFGKLQELVQTHEEIFNRCALHDWAIYAVTRGLGYRWEILPESTMLYRQHDSNVVGARKGLRAAVKRFNLIRQGWVHGQVQAILDLVERCCPDMDVAGIRSATAKPSLRNRIKLCLLVQHLRRRFIDRCFMMFLFASGLFWPKEDVLHRRESTK